jgi:hypothetical protein
MLVLDYSCDMETAQYSFFAKKTPLHTDEFEGDRIPRLVMFALSIDTDISSSGMYGTFDNFHINHPIIRTRNFIPILNVLA